MKTKEELTALKNEVKTLNAKLAELTEDELNEVIGGVDFNIPDNDNIYNIHIYDSSITGSNEEKFTEKFKIKE